MGELVALSDGDKRMMKETEVEEQSKKQQPQKKEYDDDDGSAEVVSWEKYLPRRVLRVLLVEADHSTRQIIAALLRKCSYRVVAVPDGLKAWGILKRKAPDIDLILTEVELPSISGFALLTLIVEDDICKNIPVIMMSSHDSVSMVLKCMLKGAADFLIKPVRRNELRNLWQHVWRKHAIGRPPQNITFPQKTFEDASENNAVSNQSSGSVASTQKNNECSEKVSEAQGTSQLKGSLNLSNTETLKHRESTKFEMESTKHNDETVVENSIRLVLEATRCHKTFETTDLRLERGHSCPETVNQDDVLREELATGNPYIKAEIHGCCNELVEPSRGALDLIATFKNLPKNTDVNCSLNCGNTTNFGFDTRLELYLSSDFPGSPCKQATEERQTLNHSNASAFSWYRGSKLLPPHFQSSSITSAKENDTNRDDSGESYKLSGDTVDTCHYGGNNQNQENMTTLVIGQSGQIGPKLRNSQCGLFPITGVDQQGNVFPSAFYAQSGVQPIWTSKPVCQNESPPFPTSTSSQSNPENHNSEQHHHCSDDATHSSLDQNVHDKSNLDHARNESSAADQSTGNNLCHDVINHINSSAYDSKGSGSDGNAASAVVAENKLEIFSDSGCVTYDGFRGTEPHHSSQREAALTKFRLKRKDRCYGKKVRYQSRKRLAEQRPRVKGQFVRQVHNEHPIANAAGGS